MKGSTLQTKAKDQHPKEPDQPWKVTAQQETPSKGAEGNLTNLKVQPDTPRIFIMERGMGRNKGGRFENKSTRILSDSIGTGSKRNYPLQSWS